MSAKRGAIALALLGLACAEPAAVPGTHLHMRFGSDEFYASPFPSAHRLDASGRADLRRFPNPGRVEFVDTLRAIAARDVSGFGTTSAIYFTASESLDPARLPDMDATTREGAAVFLVGVDEGEDLGRRYPVEVRFTEDGGPFGAPNMLSMLPLQGVPLSPSRTYAAVVLRGLGDAAGSPLGVPAELRAITRDERPASLNAPAFLEYRRAFESITRMGVDGDEIAALAVFTTADPTEELAAARAQVLSEPLPEIEPFAHVETHEAFCVYRSAIDMPVFQEGEPPYDGAGGGWTWSSDRLVRQRTEHARVLVTLPREPLPPGGFPTVVFVRTGGGGDRPLVDRGVRAEPGGEPIEAGTGPARGLARAGWAAISVDGPHGGLRNATGGDEQFLIFNIFNPVAMRDNLRQSALEVMLVPHLLDGLTVTATACPGLESIARFDTERIALMGHSMGATIAPLAFALEPRFRAVILSGAGGSWIHNIVYKQRPLEVRPLAEVILDYDEIGRVLTPHDPVLTLLQWAGEPADPPVYAHRLRRDASSPPWHVLMFQGIVDSYILPPIANATSLSLRLDLAGDALETSLPALLPLVGRAHIALPVEGNDAGATRAVVQHAQDDVEDGHEVVFQTEGPKHQYRCFLETLSRRGRPKIPRAGDRETDPCE